MQHGALIVVIEEHPALGTQLTRDVRRVGVAAAVEWVADADAARRRLGVLPAPDIVVMEAQIGEASGIALALWMESQPALAATQRVLYTAAPRGALAQDPALAGRRLDTVFTLILHKGAGAGPRALAEALLTLPAPAKAQPGWSGAEDVD